MAGSNQSGQMAVWSFHTSSLGHRTSVLFHVIDTSSVGGWGSWLHANEIVPYPSTLHKYLLQILQGWKQRSKKGFAEIT